MATRERSEIALQQAPVLAIMPTMNYAPYIKELGRGAKGARSLSTDQAETLFGDMLDGKVPPLELGAILIALRIKSESTEELIGFKRALDSRTPRLSIPDGPRCVILPSYNGARRQPNLMPLLAMMLTERGIPVAIQGRHDFESRISPFDLLAALGVEQAPSLEAASRTIASGKPACVGLGLLSPGLDGLLATRLTLGVRSVGHTMAKLLDPCPGRSVRVVAVTHPEYLERMDDFLAHDGGRAMLLRGTEGEAYANPRRMPRLAGYRDGERLLLNPGDEGGAPPLPDMPEGISPAANAATIRDMLAGKIPIPTPLLRQADALGALAHG